ncbi:Extracellular signal-regulated kinase 2 [Symbiodinium microadriaticum]|uniref:Extracellular signal-regulated kinase 2 n=1 Tax=Symbiodinium microadriaticum TaxID=2951 RepID=A0A1Q9E348_SYMMI|nr:Extracellular signal-regulated kinase 2 [Symbiodinium microadriaticum]
MSITVDIALLSGKTVTVKTGLDDQVETLKLQAQTMLGVGRGRLLNSSGVVLDACSKIEDAGLQNGDSLTLHIKNVQVQTTRSAFAAILGDGCVKSWGDAGRGGDSSAVQDQLTNVQQIQATDSAFAAILGDGSVVTWGDVASGGDSSDVQDQLKNVQQIQANAHAFAAILADGSVVTWGHECSGGNSSDVQDQLKNVQQIQAAGNAFAAILGDGSVVTWGYPGYGGDSSAVRDQLKNVQQIQATLHSFAAILGDRSVVTWGDAGSGGDSSAVQAQLKNVKQVQVCGFAFGVFAAILGDGSVVTWDGRDHSDFSWSSDALDQLKNVQHIHATQCDFAAILCNGSVVTWQGGDIVNVLDESKNVQQIQASENAFAAILADGSVVTWGYPGYGGDSSAVQDQLKNVQQIQATSRAFAAILGDGSVVTWGYPGYGGDSSAVQDQLKNVQQIQANERDFAAILADGCVVTWGSSIFTWGDAASGVLKDLMMALGLGASHRPTSLSHNNVVVLLDAVLPKSGNDLYLVFPAAAHDLDKAIRYNLLDGAAQRLVARDMARALRYLHESGLIHRDIKPGNVLMEPTGARLCDFGLVRCFGSSRSLTEYVGMRWYRAPELLLAKTNYSEAVDIWAYACVVAEMAECLPKLTPEDNGKATRLHSQDCLNAIAPVLPEFMGGSADLAPSNMTLMMLGRRIKTRPLRCV